MSIDCAMLKLPIGLQSFASLRTDGFAYVDKTKQVYDLAQNDNELQEKIEKSYNKIIELKYQIWLYSKHS